MTAAVLVLGWSLVLGAEPRCADWILPLYRDPTGGNDLRFGLEYQASRPADVGAFYAWLQPDPLPRAVTAATPVGHGARPSPRPLERIALPGHARPIYRIPGWYAPGARWSLALVRLPAPDPGLETLGLAVEPRLLTSPPAGTLTKFYGPLPPKVLDLEPGAPRALQPEAVVCQARSPGLGDD